MSGDVNSIKTNFQSAIDTLMNTNSLAKPTWVSNANEDIFAGQQGSVSKEDFTAGLQGYGIDEDGASAIYNLLNANGDDEIDESERALALATLGMDSDNDGENDEISIYSTLTNANSYNLGTAQLSDEAFEEYITADLQDEAASDNESDVTDELHEETANESDITDELQEQAASDNEGDITDELQSEAASEEETTDELQEETANEEDITDELQQEQATSDNEGDITDELQSEAASEEETTDELQEETASDNESNVTDELQEEAANEEDITDELQQEQAASDNESDITDELQSGDGEDWSFIENSAAKEKINKNDDGTYSITVESWGSNGSDSLDCISRIIRNVYGVEYSSQEGQAIFEALAQANSGKIDANNPDLIYAGDVITLVDLSEISE